MSLRQFRTLIAVGELGSIVAAARQLNLTQSAVSMQLRALEEQLHVKLIDRDCRPVRLTPTGAAAATRAKAVVGQYDELCDGLSQARPYRGMFRLGAVPTSLATLLPAGLMAVRARAPEVMVNVSSGLSGELLQQVMQGELDGALMQRPRKLEPGLLWREVVRQEIVVVAPAAAPEATAAAAFAAHPYIRFNRAAWVSRLIERRLTRLKIVPNTRMEIEPIGAIHQLVGMGFGISVLPNIAATSPSGAGLKTLGLGEPTVFRKIGLLTRRDSAKRHLFRIIGDAFAETSASPEG